MKVREAGKTYDVVIIGSPNVNPGYRLVNNDAYPQMAADYERMFRVLKSLPCDIFLGAHGNYFDLETKYARLKGGDLAAFVDPEGYSEVRGRQRAGVQGRTRKAKSRPAAVKNEIFPAHISNHMLLLRALHKHSGGVKKHVGIMQSLPNIRAKPHEVILSTTIPRSQRDTLSFLLRRHAPSR